MDALLTVKEAAEITRLKTKTLYAYAERRIIPSLVVCFAYFSGMHPSWLNRIVGSKLYKLNRHDNYISLYNGSEIWIGGLGDKEQVDRILGHEYNTIYFNKVSQISYHAVTTAYSRLAMKIPGCRNMFLYDCNPASPLHWSYRIFIRKIDFKTDTPIVRPEMYVSMLINPEDNRSNLACD